MLSLTPDVTASLSFSELRALVVDLIGEFRGLRAENEALHSENAALRAGNEELRTTNIALKAEVQSLRDEVARLKGLPPWPPTKPPRPSGMEKKAGKVGRPPKRRRRGPKRDAGRVDREVTLKLENVPTLSRSIHQTSMTSESWKLMDSETRKICNCNDRHSAWSVQAHPGDEPDRSDIAAALR